MTPGPVAGSPALPLVIRVDAGHGVGLGHAVRCAALAEAGAGTWNVTVVGAGPVLPRLFAGLPVTTVEARNDGDFARLLADLRPAVVVVDHPSRNPALAGLVRHALPEAGVAVIDDGGGAGDAGDAGLGACDLVVNGTVLGEDCRYPGVPRVLAGPRYALLRPVFGRTRWIAEQEMGQGAGQGTSGVVMVVGGGDRAAAWAFFLASGALDRRGWGRPRLVVGAAYPEPERLAAACAAAGIERLQGLDAPRLAALLAGASAALVTGGMIVYEALAVGVPTAVFPLLPDMPPETRRLAGWGCLHDLGPEGGFDPGTVVAALAGLLGDPKAAAGMSDRQRRLVDGQGARRVAGALLDLGQVQQSGSRT